MVSTPAIDTYCRKSIGVFQHNEKDNIEYGEYTCHRHILKKVDCLGVAERKNQYDTGGGHDEVSVEIPDVTELRSDQACKRSVKLITDDDEECDASAEAIHRDN